jgi:hypothetical protein
MNGPGRGLSVPAELKTFEEPSCLLPGENRREFELIRQMILEDISPRTNIEWLWILDLMELSWEILRYRRLKEKTLQVYRSNAIASLLQRMDGAGMPAQSRPMVQVRCGRAATEWCEDRDAACEIEARLERNGFDSAAINAEVFAQAQQAFGLFDQLMQSAQHRRITLLREIATRRGFEKRAPKIRCVAKALGNRVDRT